MSELVNQSADPAAYTSKTPATAASAAPRPRVMCVDDEPNVLSGLMLHLRRKYDVVTANSGAEALALIDRDGAPAVVVSDMRMPHMDGATLLAAVRARCPETTRVLLTGHSDMNAAIAAVNEGQIFRFLTKPCPPPVLVSAIEAAVQQNRLISSERVLLQDTLRGAIKTLGDVLALANPTAFGRATRIKLLALDVVNAINPAVAWQVEVAAIFAQIACVTLAPATVDKLYYGAKLTKDEELQVSRMPSIADGLLASIPRLEDVRAILANLHKNYDGGGPPANGLKGDDIPLGARILRAVTDYETLDVQGIAVAHRALVLKKRVGVYDPAVVDALAALHTTTAQAVDVREVPARFVRTGMVLAEDVRTVTSALIAPRGYEVTDSLVERLRNFAPGTLREPLRVIVKKGAAV
jgi:response regulator RpfG family c-di-GMP phosphodiesterase